MAKNNFFQQNNRQKTFSKNKPPIHKAKDKKDNSYGNKNFKNFKNDNRANIEKQKSHDSFFIKPSKVNFLPPKQTTHDTGFKESKIPKIIKPDKNKLQNSKDSEGTDKPAFDKKLYRLKKYSNKFKLQQWEEQRKKVALRNLKKSTRGEDSEKKFNVEKIYEEYKKDLESDSEVEELTKEPVTESEPKKILNQRSLADKFEREEHRKHNKSFKNAQSKFQDIIAQKQAQREEFLRKKQEKEEALKVYKKKKAEKYKKLSMKTKKGQPVMKGRMELLLEQIQNSIHN